MSEVRETIGQIRCPIGKDLAEVRRNKKGKLYYLGAAGMITPNKPAGQDWILENMQAFDPEQKAGFNASAIEYGGRVGVSSPAGKEDKPIKPNTAETISVKDTEKQIEKKTAPPASKTEAGIKFPWEH